MAAYMWPFNANERYGVYIIGTRACRVLSFYPKVPHVLIGPLLKGTLVCNACPDFVLLGKTTTVVSRSRMLGCQPEGFQCTPYGQNFRIPPLWRAYVAVLEMLLFS